MDTEIVLYTHYNISDEEALADGLKSWQDKWGIDGVRVVVHYAEGYIQLVAPLSEIQEGARMGSTTCKKTLAGGLNS